MKKTAFALLAVVTAITTTSAFAQSTGNLYGEVAYGMASLKDTSAEDKGTFKPSVARFTLGTVVVDNLAVEGYLVQGLSSDSKKQTDGTNVTIKFKSGYGVALRPFVKATEDLELYARIGTSRNKSDWSATNGGTTESGSDTVTQSFYGLGAAYKIDKNWSAVVDYSKFAKKLDTDSSMVAIGARYNF
jgi:Outer membrane protein beta-barrel domain